MRLLKKTWVEFSRRLHYRSHRHHSRHRRHHHVVFVVNGYAVELIPHTRIHIMLQVSVGHSVNCSIEYLDQNGNPMLTPVTPDSPPVWADTPATPPVDTFTVATDGSSAVLAATAVGADTVSLTVIVGGKTYAASLAVSITAAPQVLTSVAINGVVQ
jgi:hypothetical protein